FDCEKNGKSSKKLQIFVLPGAQGASFWAQGAGDNTDLLFAVCFLRNARAVLRVARVSAGNVIFDSFLHYKRRGTPLEQG
ncbi:hypothetical protein A2U01_0085512, partial [Trifolium medium]|nr:hypothetical protein [Trifolium medium]